VWLLDSKRRAVDLLVNTAGVFHGTKLVQIKRNGRHLCDVSAGGSWDIVIAPPMQLEEMSHIRGGAQAGTDLIRFDGGLRLFKLPARGRRAFRGLLLDSHGERVELLVNTAGKFDGSKAVKRGGSYALDVSADGLWNIAWR
jgi:hypothetical protein